jgi:hypothetical protein
MSNSTCATVGVATPTGRFKFRYRGSEYASNSVHVLKSATTSFAIYRHQAKIFVVLSDGPVGYISKIFKISGGWSQFYCRAKVDLSAELTVTLAA